MIIKQLSVFLENKKGCMLDVLDALARSGVNISALTLADNEDYGILRLIVDDPKSAANVLSEDGIVVRVTEVLAVAMDDTPGGAVSILKLLFDYDVDVQYSYACVGKVSGKAIFIMRVNAPERAQTVLRDNGLDDVDINEIYRV